MAELIPGKYDARYFADLFATGDTEILPHEQIIGNEDEKTLEEKAQIQLAKYNRLLNRLRNIKAGIGQPWFKDLEMVLMTRVRKIESNLIWTALENEDAKRIKNLSVERMGIVTLFESFMNISSTIEETIQKIDDLSDNKPGSDDADRHLND